MGGGGGGGDYGTGGRRHHQPHADRKPKVIRLSELISVLRLPPNAEACPMENMSAFCVETQDRTMVFAALKDDCVEWVEKLCQSTFQQGAGSGSSQLRMEENQIYVSVEEASEFWVVVQATDAAARNGLQGSYWLQVGQEALLLKDTHEKNVVQEWPYELLRRYGKDKLTFTIEAGRRCNCGPGSFIFETLQADKIFSMIQSTIKRKTSPVTEKLIIPNLQAQSPLPTVPDTTNMAAILENKLRIQDKKPTAGEESPHPQESSGSSSGPAPITLMPLPLVPTHDSHQVSSRPEAIYAEPADCIQPAPEPQSSMGLYVDPASVLPLTPPTARKSAASSPDSSHSQPRFDSNHPESVYSEVYDKISPVGSIAQDKCFTNKEPIYFEPVSKTKEAPRETESKPDPFAHLYAKVCKPAQPSSPSSPCGSTPAHSATPSSTAAAATTATDDVIYENLGII
ncbi:uncharacterized protein V6R79_011956 [Siganus canaliculatus]